MPFLACHSNKLYVTETMECLLRYTQKHYDLLYLLFDFCSIFSGDIAFRETQITTASMMLQHQAKTINSIMKYVIVFAKCDLFKAEFVMCVLLDGQREVRLSKERFFAIIDDLSVATVSHVLRTRLQEVDFNADEFEQKLLNEQSQRSYQGLAVLLDNLELLKNSQYTRHVVELLLLSGNQTAVEKALNGGNIPVFHDTYNLVLFKMCDRLEALTGLWERETGLQAGWSTSVGL
jgi:hypothetical protein